jgi:hypothetical protein
MAKKVRTRIEEKETPSFEFPVFDEKTYVRHELELTWATVIVVAVAILLGILSYLVARTGLPAAIAAVVGVVGIVASPPLVQRIRESAGSYTKGDWAGLIAVELFLWLGIWFML